MTEQERRAAADALRELREALDERGIVLPSLELDRMPRYHLIELGRCNADTARDLAAALRGTSPRGPGPAPDVLRLRLADLSERVREHLGER